MIKKNIYIFLILSIIAISIFLYKAYFPNESFSPKRQIAFKIVGELATNFSSKYGLHFSGISEAAWDGKYNTIGIELSYDKIINKEQGRLLLINCAKEALELFNSTPEFQQYMSNYPFTGENIIVNIHIEPVENSDVFFPDYAIFSIFGNILHYKTIDQENKYKICMNDEETYEEALKIIEANLDKDEMPKPDF